MKKGGSKEKYKQLTGDSVSVFVCMGVCRGLNHLIKNDNGSDEMIGQKMGTVTWAFEALFCCSHEAHCFPVKC